MHRDTLEYVRVWRELASDRRAVGRTAYFDGTILTPKERQKCFQAYLTDFNSEPLRPGQKRGKGKSYAEAHLREIAANRHIAFLIWEVGIPQIAVQSLEENIIAILDWLGGAAQSITQYKETERYQEAVRTAGSSHGTSGLTQEEQIQRADLRRAQANVRRGKHLADRWDRRLITYETISEADFVILQQHWNGNHNRQLLDIQLQRGDRRISMPTLWTRAQRE